MADDDPILSALTPIGAPAPRGANPPALRLSRDEARRRGGKRKARRADQGRPNELAHQNPHAAVGAAQKALETGPRMAYRKKMDTEEALGMAATLAEQFYRQSTDPDATPTQRKHSATAWAIVIDKWTILSGRPTQIIATADLELQRPQMEILGVKLFKVLQGGWPIGMSG